MNDEYRSQRPPRRSSARTEHAQSSRRRAGAPHQRMEDSDGYTAYPRRRAYGADSDAYRAYETRTASGPRYDRAEQEEPASSEDFYDAYEPEDDYDEGDFDGTEPAESRFAPPRSSGGGARRERFYENSYDQRRSPSDDTHASAQDAMPRRRSSYSNPGRRRPDSTSARPGADASYYDAYDNSEEGKGGSSGRGGGSGRNMMRQGHVKRKKHRSAGWRIARVVLVLLIVFAGFSFAKTLTKGIHWTVAVFGVDSRDGSLEKGTRSDVIMLANINQLTGEVKLCSVFRDTYLRIDPDGTYNKINEAYAKGGHKQAIEALEDNLDVKIDDYVTFNWAAVAKGINALGGIDLDISDAEFSYINAFITETVNSTGIGSTQLAHAGMNHLDGVQAVAYGRLRLMDTDYNRTARQRKVISLALDKAKTANAGQLASAAKALITEVSTSIDVGDVIPIINSLGKYNIPEDGSSGFPFSRQTMKIHKQDCVIPTTLESNVVTLHQFLFGKENFKPSATVKKISSEIGAATGLTEAGENAPEAKTGGGIVHKDKAKPAAPKAAEPAAPSESETSTSETETETETESSGSEADSARGENEADEPDSDLDEWVEQPDISDEPDTPNQNDGPGSGKPSGAGSSSGSANAGSNNAGPGVSSDTGAGEAGRPAGDDAAAPTEPAVIAPEGGPGALLEQ